VAFHFAKSLLDKHNLPEVELEIKKTRITLYGNPRMKKQVNVIASTYGCKSDHTNMPLRIAKA